jgi:hypothetical protein
VVITMVMMVTFWPIGLSRKLRITVDRFTV